MNALFKPAQVTSAYLKMALFGLAGSGKTYTATSIAIGVCKMLDDIRAEAAHRPIFFLDTEKGSDWVKPRIEAAGLTLWTAKTRAFSDLLAAVDEAEANASLLLVDSLTHFWKELCESYMRSKNRTRLQFEDWAFLKERWGKFTDKFVNSAVHCILAGRAGYEYDYTVDDETGKKNLEKTGIKIKAESEMGYEPDLLVLMERVMDMTTLVNNHVATVQKDRSTLLDGKDFINPTFETFLPHIKCLNLGGRQLGVDTSRTSDHTIPKDIRDNRRTQRKIVLAEIEDLLVLHFPSSAQKDKAAKIALLKSHFQATWTEIEEVMTLERLRAGFETLHVELEGKPSRYAAVVVPQGPAGPVPGALPVEGHTPLPLPNGRDHEPIVDDHYATAGM